MARKRTTVDDQIDPSAQTTQEEDEDVTEAIADLDSDLQELSKSDPQPEPKEDKNKEQQPVQVMMTQTNTVSGLNPLVYMSLGQLKRWGRRVGIRNVSGMSRGLILSEGSRLIASDPGRFTKLNDSVDSLADTQETEFFQED